MPYMKVKVGEAVFIRKLKKWRGIALLYKINPTITWPKFGWQEDEVEFEYIVISTVHKDRRRVDTLVFGSDKRGNANELHVLSETNSKDINNILAEIGYKLIQAPKAEKVVAAPKRIIRLED